MGKVIIANILLSFLVFSSFFFLWPVQRALVFYYENSDEMVAYLPVKTGDSFQIIFTHSIHLSDVLEKYRVLENGQIEQYEIVYGQYGIGMPSNAEDGQQFLYKDGKYHIQNMGLRFTSMNIRNGKTVSRHRLVWGREEEHLVWFNDYFLPGEWYTVKVENLPRWKVLKGVEIVDDR